MKVPSILEAVEPDKKKPERIDLAFEEMVLRCGIGCLIRDMPMTESDYVRLYLAMFRLGRNG